MDLVRRAALSVFITLFVGGLLGPVVSMVTVRLGTDPWLGAHAAMMCARVCDGCRGPYETRGGTQVNGSSRRGQASKLYCQPPQGTLDEAGDLSRYEFVDGTLWVMAGAWLYVVPAVALATFGVLTVLARRKAPRAGT